jgi:hypothetical protein
MFDACGVEVDAGGVEVDACGEIDGVGEPALVGLFVFELPAAAAMTITRTITARVAARIGCRRNQLRFGAAG